MDLNKIEQELKKRLKHPYIWGRKQSNDFDRSTNFIYEIFEFDILLKKIEAEFGKNEEVFFNYTINRWYNFWSARAIENIFCSLPGVEPALDARDKLKDFMINGIEFDHKTSVFPRGYPDNLQIAMQNPLSLIKWLYENQSQQQRKHLKNRLFIILYSKNGDHWKLKAEILWLKGLIENYVGNFNKTKLHKLTLESNSITFSDIIWAIK